MISKPESMLSQRFITIKMSKKKKLKPKTKAIILLFFCTIGLVLILAVSYPKIRSYYIQKQRCDILNTLDTPDWIESDIIEIHDSARTGRNLNQLNNIVVHYVGNPNTTAKQNRDFFNNEGTEVSAHFVVGLEGEIVQCLPLNEISAASNHRNVDTISIEVCHPDESGKYSYSTYNALIKLLAWLCDSLKLSAEDVIRHYDVTGKLCPLYYVENPAEWEQLISDVEYELSVISAEKQ